MNYLSFTDFKPPDAPTFTTIVGIVSYAMKIKKLGITYGNTLSSNPGLYLSVPAPN